MLSKNIIGNGFIAGNFKSYSKLLKKLNIYLYACGVSNSQCTNIRILEKDFKTLVNFQKKYDQNKKILYFSTCGIYDPSRKNKPYFVNKVKIEKFIKRNFINYLIIRVPEIVGKSNNKKNLINFLYEKITKKKKFNLWLKSTRSIIDIDDLSKILIFIIKNKNIKNKIINIANPKKISILNIVKEIERLTSIKAKYKLIKIKKSKGWKINTFYIKDVMTKIKIKFDKKYLKRVLRKYY